MLLSLEEFKKTYVDPYYFRGMGYLYDPEKGWIVWRVGTGKNVELLHIRTTEKGKGYGRELVYHMLDRLRDSPPYYSVFGFTRSSNTEARKFYEALGFELREVSGVYMDGTAFLFFQSYEVLLEKMQEYKS